MKKIISIGLVLIMVLSLASCGKSSEEKYADIAVETLKTLFSDAGTTFDSPIEEIMVKIYDEPQEVRPFEDSDEGYSDVKAKVIVYFTIDGATEKCCVLINSDSTKSGIELVATEDWQEVYEADIEKLYSEYNGDMNYIKFAIDYRVERNKQRNATYFPNETELSSWFDVDVSKFN